MINGTGEQKCGVCNHDLLEHPKGRACQAMLTVSEVHEETRRVRCGCRGYIPKMEAK